MKQVSKIRWLRRKLLKLAMWGDPEARIDHDYDETDKIINSPYVEDKAKLRMGLLALWYLQGKRT